jgi:hypothetical protein
MYDHITVASCLSYIVVWREILNIIVRGFNKFINCVLQAKWQNKFQTLNKNTIFFSIKRKKNLSTVCPFLTSLSLYIFTIWKCIAYYFFCRDGIYFDNILVSEYKLFKRSNKAIFPAYGVYISQLIRYARPSSNYSDFLKRHLHLRNRLLDQGYKKIRLIKYLSKQYHIRWRKCQKYFYVTHWQKKNYWHFNSLSLYIFTIWKCIAYNFFCRDGTTSILKS